MISSINNLATLKNGKKNIAYFLSLFYKMYVDFVTVAKRKYFLQKMFSLSIIAERT